MQKQTQTNAETSAQATKLSIGKASEYLGVSIDTLRRWEKKGRVNAYRSPGGHRYFEKNDLDNLFGKKYSRESKPETKLIQEEKSIETELKKEHQPQEPVAPITANEPPPSPPAPVLEPQPTVQKVSVDGQISTNQEEVPDAVVNTTEESVEAQQSQAGATQVKLDRIITGQKDKRVFNFQKIGVYALIAFAIIDVVLVILFLTSRTILSPIP